MEKYCNPGIAASHFRLHKTLCQCAALHGHPFRKPLTEVTVRRGHVGVSPCTLQTVTLEEVNNALRNTEMYVNYNKCLAI